MKKILYIFFMFGVLGFSQESEDGKTNKKDLQTSKNLTWEGNKDIAENDFINAEANYRRAISKSTDNPAASYNLGNAYYNKETYSEAFGRFKQAGELASTKEEKHQAYHNMGNVFMKRKEYEKAVEAYKEALRNDSTDEETRYNLALAKELLKKQQDEEQKNDENKDDQNQEDKEDKNEDKKDEGDKEKDDKGEQKEDENKDKGDEGDKGDEKPEENKEGDGDKKEEEKKQPNEGDKPQEQQPRPNQLSPQQVQNLLEAMQNEEKKVQEKIDAQKVKGIKTKMKKIGNVIGN
ncbi:tetratricopeptide (TPR) repeat protein [Saonia flava]|uniref:Tetratricopeptide (TPR) repeat protein n=1 Tax=Saonia flava TaxID=523696 RepID=A0A846QVN6_9FLAO|nr:tetratricopeptide repeat protein [Saonia flava]NJB71297.1 tetratricopeptide (TPR) repeat protein [Saonia flava]